MGISNSKMNAEPLICLRQPQAHRNSPVDRRFL
nr:MAG TPA: hypothetical protein [Bacteriophage sp.]